MSEDDISKDDTLPTALKQSRKLGELDVRQYLGDPELKQQFVTPMFDIIAPRYDRFTRLFSLGMDRGWKLELETAVLKAVRHRAREWAGHGVATQDGSFTNFLDLACGTGDIAIALARAVPDARMTGLDASARMIELANKRIASSSSDEDVAARVEMITGDMSALQFLDASMDVVTAGYGLRNVPQPGVAVREIARVLRPGGILVTLDFYRPESTIWRKLLLGYLSAAGNAVGWWWHRDPIVYGYIAHSIDTFMSWQAFRRLLEQEGFDVESVTRHLAGGIALHQARKR